MWPKWYSPPVLPRLPFSDMLRFVASHYGVTPGEIKGSSRAPALTQGRSIIAKVLRERGLSYPVIARLLGRKDHSTVIHMMKTFDDRAKWNPEMLAIYQAIKVSENRAERLAA